MDYTSAKQASPIGPAISLEICEHSSISMLKLEPAQCLQLTNKIEVHKYFTLGKLVKSKIQNCMVFHSQPGESEIACFQVDFSTILKMIG